MDSEYEYKWILKVLDRLMDTWTKGNDLKILEFIYIHKIVPSLNNQNSSCP